MEILYDISLLGIGHYGSKSGLFRVAESFLRQIKIEHNYNLKFCSSLSFETWIKSLDYLESNRDFYPILFVSQTTKTNYRRNLYQLGKKVMNIVHKFGLFEDRFLPYSLLKLLDYNFNCLDTNDLKSVNIYHSFYHGFPQVIKNNKNIIKFITVHDIIPFLYPHFLGINGQSLKFDSNFNLKESLDSIDEDTWILCVSNSTKNDLCNYLREKIDQDKVLVIYPAASKLFTPCLDEEKIAITQQKYSIPSAPYILSLSTLEPRKNIEHTIRCFAKLIKQEKIDDLYLVLVGNKGWNYDNIFKTISENSYLQKRIIVTGYIPDEDIAVIYSGALLFVYPSFYEGFGLPPLEAMQCGVPVITSNTSSLAEVVGDAGIMLNPTDVDALCDNMLKIYNDTDWRQNLSLKSKQQAEKFSWAKSVQETISAYQKSLNLV
ncbi:glycosyltransferase family 4 protein [Geminocystis sp.]|uniref:glycosyltransferase family 4 protein n=1 Tax=Geminocystis sp. TaxID=2664100 RepID=UPI0035944207